MKGSVKKALRHGTSCVYCGTRNPLIMTLDHVIPTSQGGSTHADNLQPSCRICNQLKDNMSHEQFVKYLKALKILYDLNMARLKWNEGSVMIQHKAYYHDNWPTTDALKR